MFSMNKAIGFIPYIKHNKSFMAPNYRLYYTIGGTLAIWSHSYFFFLNCIKMFKVQSVKTLVHNPFSRVGLKWSLAPEDLAKEELSSEYIFLEFGGSQTFL